ncbi:MAG: hypothetical protein RJQ09_05595 [Cyclobacteriaceae bacterium]
MQKGSLSILLIFQTVLLFAQETDYSPEKALWYQGKVTFKNGNSFTGLISYNQDFDAVYYEFEGEVKTLTPKMLQGFSFVNPQNQMRHVFASYPDRTVSGYTRDRFFEQIVTGYCDIIRINNFVYILTLDNQVQRLKTQDESEYYFFVDDRLIEIEKFQRQIFDIYPLSKKEISEYIENEGLDLKKRDDQVLLVVYLNELMEESAN